MSLSGDAPPPPPAYPPAFQQPAYPAWVITGPAPGLKYAGFWIRFLAYVIDVLIVGVPFGALFFVIFFATGAQLTCSNSAGVPGSVHCNFGAGGWLIPVLDLLALAVSATYFTYFWHRGSTLGQRLLGLRVVDASSGGQITVGRAAGRFLGFLVSAWVVYIGLIWAAFDARKQGWHDKMASTFVVRRVDTPRVP